MSKRSRSNRNVLDEDNDNSYESIILTPNRHRKQGKRDNSFSREELKRIEEENCQAKRMRKKVEIANNWSRAINAIYPLFTDVFAEPGLALNATGPFPAKVMCQKFHFCDHEKQTPVATLLRHHMFPGSPSNPKIAFHIELLRAFDILKGICFISYEGFTDFVSSLQRKHVSSSMHRTFADAYNAYPMADEISDSAGNRLIITIDGNFDLKKTKTGEQPSAYHVQTMVKRYFLADEKVAKYANNNEYTADDNDDYCEAFKNADPKRTSLAQSHFAINGVLGSLCARHAVLQKFANII
ncbi:hypothetical protein BJV82DRAFT_661688 [Fennellomyces sp. T-0311]|nr:hypothetical protein BJV82DRAFT_661688 [Fennellomyces sp. T-0311]